MAVVIQLDGGVALVPGTSKIVVPQFPWPACTTVASPVLYSEASLFVTAGLAHGTGAVQSSGIGLAAGLATGTGVACARFLALKNTAEGGSNTTAVTAGNSGGVSGDALTQGGVGTITFDNSQVFAGSLAYKFVTSASLSYTGWNPLPYNSAILYLRAYIYLTNYSIGYVFRAGAGALGLGITGTGHISAIGPGGNVNGTGTAMSLNTWYRIEGMFVSGAGNAQTFARLYDASGTLQDSVNNAANNNVSALNFALIGSSVSNSTNTFWMDNLAASDQTWIGTGAPVVDGLAVGLTPGLATGTGIAQTSDADNQGGAGLVSGTGTAGAPGAELTPGFASATGTAQAPTAQIPVFVAAGLAIGTGAAQAPDADNQGFVGLASGTGLALAPGISLAAGSATGLAIAQPSGSAVAAGTGLADGLVTVQAPGIGLAAGSASGTGGVPSASAGSQGFADLASALTEIIYGGGSYGEGFYGLGITGIGLAPGFATGTGASQAPDADNVGNAGFAPGTSIVTTPAVIAITAGTATGIGTVSSVTAALTAAGLVTGTGQASVVSFALVADTATGSGTSLASDADNQAGAGLASGTGATPASAIDSQTTLGVAVGTGTVLPVAAAIATDAVLAVGIGVALASEAGFCGDPGALGSGLALDAGIATAITAGVANGVSTAPDASADFVTVAGLATGTGTVLPAAPAVTPSLASGTGSVLSPSTEVALTAGVATGTGITAASLLLAAHAQAAEALSVVLRPGTLEISTIKGHSTATSIGQPMVSQDSILALVPAQSAVNQSASSRNGAVSGGAPGASTVTSPARSLSGVS